MSALREVRALKEQVSSFASVDGLDDQWKVDCRNDLMAFTEAMFRARKGVDMRHNWHQQKMVDALNKVVSGETSRLIINIPPRSGKTELAVINFMAWCMGKYPDSEFIHASYSKRLATTNTFSTRAVVEHEKFAEIFGAPRLRNDSNAKDEWRTSQGGIVYATGADGTITGYGAGKMREGFAGAIIIDDPHKAGEANSDTMRSNVIDWFQTTMESRKNRPDTPIIVIMQRLHESDLSGWLLDGGNGEEWEHLNIPAEVDGESFWPEQFPIEDLKRKERSNSYVYAGQYLQRPAPIGGGIFKEEWWNYYEMLPRIEYRIITADTAQKTKEHNDYSVFQCWGVTESGDAYLIDMVRGKWEAPELLVNARAFWEKHFTTPGMGALRSMNIEDKVSGTGLIQTLQREGITIKAVQRNTDKITRALDVAPAIESGRVYLPKSASYLSDFIREHSQFPNAVHDDCVDPAIDAVYNLVVSPPYKTKEKPVNEVYVNPVNYW